MRRNVAPSGLLESCEREHDRKGKIYYGNGWKNDYLRYEVKAKTTGDEIEERVCTEFTFSKYYLIQESIYPSVWPL